MKIVRFAILVTLAAAGTTFAQVAPYDYWVVLSPGGSATDASGVTERVKVVVGNNGAPGSNAGPSYDIILTVTKGGQAVCAAGYTTLPPIQKGQQLVPLELRIVYPKIAPPKTKLPSMVTYTVEGNLRTNYPNDDTNPGNGYQLKTFTFKSSGKASCVKLLGQ